MTAQGPGVTTIYVMAQDGSGKRASCRVTVEAAVPVSSVTVCPTNKTMSVGDSLCLSATVCPANTTNKAVRWSSSNMSVAYVDYYSGRVYAKEPGTAIIYARAQNNNSIYGLCHIYCSDTYTCELVKTFGFTNEGALLIRSLYNKIDIVFYSENLLQRAWRCSRLLGGIVYGNETSGMKAQYKWKDVAGQVFEGSEEEYFTNVLGYTEAEYRQLANAISIQHGDTTTPDFAHMQISLSARLAYHLNLDGFLSNIGTFCSDEHISYLAGWLGDATILANGTTSLGDDDYCADLDAENIFRYIIKGQSSVSAINTYYEGLNSTFTRADKFLSHINYSIIEEKVFHELADLNLLDLLPTAPDPDYICMLIMADLKTHYPDTYNFLCSLKNRLAHLSEY